MGDLFAPKHLLIILAIVLLVFGTKKVKTLGADLGSAIKSLRSGISEGAHLDEKDPPA
jgi:sec-independent protein translocase protein TatA